MLNRISIRSDFVTSDHSRYVVLFAPSFGDIWAEPDSDASFGRSSSWVFLRVGPEKLSKPLTKEKKSDVSMSYTALSGTKAKRPNTHLAHQSFLTRLLPISINLLHIIERHTVLAE